jgi:hypothetical protein
MSKKRKAGHLPPFIPLFKDTVKTDAWKALSHGARSLYAVLKSRYNNKLQNSVFVSTRVAKEELGRGSRNNVLIWFRELEHYGFIVETSPAHHGVNGQGKAPHYRLTEEGHNGKEPTRDFMRWDGSPFTEKRKREAPIKNRIRGCHGGASLVATGVPLVPDSDLQATDTGCHGGAMCSEATGCHGDAITTLATTIASASELIGSVEALWSSPISIPLKWLKLRHLFQAPGKRPGEMDRARYLARWYSNDSLAAAA